MEGNHHSSPIHCDAEFVQLISRFRDELGFNEVHYTGGEPSIHPEVESFVRVATEMGFKVKMTSNGQLRPDRYLRLIDAGLREINFSIHTLIPAELGRMMAPPRSEAWGQAALTSQLRLLSELRGLVGLKVNSVVVDDEANAKQIKGVVSGLGAEWRVMNELYSGEASYEAIRRLCDSMGATPISAVITSGSSSYSLEMVTTDDFRFRVKLIRAYRIPSMCTNCPVDREGKCVEYAYGPRLESAQDGLAIRSCLHRSGEPFTLTTNAFFESQLFRDQRDAIRGVV